MLKKIINTILFILLAIEVIGQAHLPNVQLNGVRIPDEFRVDQKSKGAQDTMRAFNHSTNIYYLIGNNDKQLYLEIQCKDPVTIKKIFGGGISFRINKVDQRNSDAKLTITYPVLDATSRAKIGTDLKESENARNLADSAILRINNDIAGAGKQIKVEGLPGTTDSIVSVYNRQNIKVKLRFDSDILVYKLLIPLNYITDDIIKEKFYYNIMLNGLDASIRTVVPKHDDRVVSVAAIPKGYSGSSDPSFDYKRYPTDFWGEYNLVPKK